MAVSSSVKQPDPEWEYCGVNLTIHNIIIPEERLLPTPSQLDNMDYETEMDLRIVGCELIQDAGILLKLPQVAMATAQVLYQRFFYSKSFVRHFYEVSLLRVNDCQHYAMACLFLAAKLEECPRRIRDIINVFHHIRQIRENRNPTPVILDQNYSNLKNQVIKAERRVLKELGFCVHAKHPHKALDQEMNVKLVQTAWNYMNDSLRTDIFVRYLPEAIACGCIHLASCKLNVPLPRNPSWWEMFSVSEESVREISLCLLRLYARPKPDVTVLEAELAQLRKTQIEAKERELEQKKLQAAAAVTTPPSAQSDHSSGCVSPASKYMKLSQSSETNGSKSVTDSQKSSKESSAAAPNSILASALATVKAASINASKTAVLPSNEPTRAAFTIGHTTHVNNTNELSGDDARRSVSPSPRDVNHEAPVAKRHHRSPSSRTISKKLHKRSRELSEDHPKSGSRPAAYPNVPVTQNDDDRGQRRHHRHSAKKSRHSSYSSSDGDLPDRQPPSSLASNAHRSRHYRLGPNQINHQSSSASETPESSPTVIKRRDPVSSGGRKRSPEGRRRQGAARRCSSDDSQSSDSDSDHRGVAKSSGRHKNSPPAAYRLEHRSSHSSKHRSSSGVSSSNGNLHHTNSSRHRDHRRR